MASSPAAREPLTRGMSLSAADSFGSQMHIRQPMPPTPQAVPYSQSMQYPPSPTRHLELSSTPPTEGLRPPQSVRAPAPLFDDALPLITLCKLPPGLVLRLGEYSLVLCQVHVS